MVTAATSPPMRVSRNGPIPIPSRWSRLAGVVMLFHSPMSRMNSTLPEALEGEMDPKTASCRSHHGAMTSTKTATHATAAANGMAGRFEPRRPPRAPPIEQEDREPRLPRTSSPSLRDRVARPASRPAAMNARPEP